MNSRKGNFPRGNIRKGENRHQRTGRVVRSGPGSGKGGSQGITADFGGKRLIMGRNTVREALLKNDKSIETLLAAESQSNEERRSAILELANKKGIAVSSSSFDELTAVVRSDSHQGFVAVMKGERFTELRDYLSGQAKNAKQLVVLLDEIHDPQNFGSILRAAECFGANAVVWSKNRGAPLSPVVSKVSVGASELLTLIQVSNLVDAAKKLKENGFWLIGADVNTEASPLSQFEFPEKVAVVLGSEESGMHDLLARQLDYRIFIPMHGKIDSLNVSQAAAVILSAVRRN